MTNFGIPAMTGARAITIRLARPADAPVIARMSRDTIEHGLGWRWTTGRVRRSIGDRATNVIVATAGNATVLGFASMKYLEEEAHLLLLAVAPVYRRHGLGRSLLAWLDDTALVAGIGAVLLEVRAANPGAREFYRRLGYVEGERLESYYGGAEAAVRMRRNLRPALDTRTT